MRLRRAPDNYDPADQRVLRDELEREDLRNLKAGIFSLERFFTPTLSFGGNSVDITYSEQYGVGIVLGGWFFFHIVMILSSNGSSTGAAVIDGLPFVASSAGNDISISGRAVGLDAAVSNFTAQIEAGTTTISLLNAASGTTTALDEGDLPDTANILLDGFYKIA